MVLLLDPLLCLLYIQGGEEPSQDGKPTRFDFWAAGFLAAKFFPRLPDVVAVLLSDRFAWRIPHMEFQIPMEDSGFT